MYNRASYNDPSQRGADQHRGKYLRQFISPEKQSIAKKAEQILNRNTYGKFKTERKAAAALHTAPSAQSKIGSNQSPLKTNSDIRHQREAFKQYEQKFMYTNAKSSSINPYISPGKIMRQSASPERTISKRDSEKRGNVGSSLKTSSKKMMGHQSDFKPQMNFYHHQSSSLVNIGGFEDDQAGQTSPYNRRTTANHYDRGRGTSNLQQSSEFGNGIQSGHQGTMPANNVRQSYFENTEQSPARTPPRKSFIQEQQTCWRNRNTTNFDSSQSPVRFEHQGEIQDQTIQLYNSPEVSKKKNFAESAIKPQGQRDFSPSNPDLSPSPQRKKPAVSQDLHINLQNLNASMIRNNYIPNIEAQLEVQRKSLEQTHDVIAKQRDMHREVDQILIPGLKHEVYMRCVTWTRDSHGLFDYESKNIAKRNIKTQTGGKIVRAGDEIQLVSRSYAAPIEDETKNLILLEKNHAKKGYFIIRNDSGQESRDEDQMFVVVRNTKSTANNQDYQLCRGDVIKMGRIKFRVQNMSKAPASEDLDDDDDFYDSADEMVDDVDIKSVNLNEEHFLPSSRLSCGNSSRRQFDPQDPQSQMQCKVCWSSDQTQSNPLLNSCQCDGSVRFIHYLCLKRWLQQKMQRHVMEVKQGDTKVGECITFTWRSFECEICKTPYPYEFKSNGNRYRLIDYVDDDIPKVKSEPYLLLQSLTFEKNTSRIVHVLRPNETKAADGMKIFKMGRGHESEVRVCDISVSRCHARIKFNEQTKRFQMEDNLSKFGTLIIANKSHIDIKPEMTKAVQIGRSVISFTIKEVGAAQNTNLISSVQNVALVPQLNQRQSHQPAQLPIAAPPQFQAQIPALAREQSLPKILHPTFLEEESKQIQDESITIPDNREDIERELRNKIEQTNLQIQTMLQSQMQQDNQHAPQAQNKQDIEQFLIDAANNLLRAKEQFDQLNHKEEQKEGNTIQKDIIQTYNHGNMAQEQREQFVGISAFQRLNDEVIDQYKNKYISATKLKRGDRNGSPIKGSATLPGKIYSTNNFNQMR